MSPASPDAALMLLPMETTPSKFRSTRRSLLIGLASGVNWAGARTKSLVESGLVDSITRYSVLAQKRQDFCASL